MNLPYILLRVIRHFLPESLVRWMLHRNLVIEAGLETRDPAQAVARYLEALTARGVSVADAHILIFGYGGNLAVAIGLLEAGCGHITVCDHIAPTEKHENDLLRQRFPRYFQPDAETARPNPQWITAYHGDIKTIPAETTLGPFDIILSNSVFEHLDDVAGISLALSRLLKAGGCMLSFVDLRDHYFKYPFEMLCYSERVWRGFLNPSSNLNRWRVWQYEQALGTHYRKLTVEILASNLAEYRKASPRIRAEFKQGDAARDAALRILVFGQQPAIRN